MAGIIAIHPGKGNRGIKFILNLMTLEFEVYAAAKTAAEAHHMTPYTLLHSRRERRNIRLIGVDCSYSEAIEFVGLVHLAQKGFKKVEKKEKAF